MFCNLVGSTTLSAQLDPEDMREVNYHILEHWLRCLRRRSQRHKLTWRKMMRIAERWLPARSCGTPIPTGGSTS